jgi:hypothetical protein
LWRVLAIFKENFPFKKKRKKEGICVQQHILFPKTFKAKLAKYSPTKQTLGLNNLLNL